MDIKAAGGSSADAQVVTDTPHSVQGSGALLRRGSFVGRLTGGLKEAWLDEVTERGEDEEEVVVVVVLVCRSIFNHCKNDLKRSLKSMRRTRGCCLIDLASNLATNLVLKLHLHLALNLA